MTTLEVGKKLVEHCNAGKNEHAIEALYADDVVSVEAGAPPGQNREAHGKPAVLGKSKWWTENHIVHSAKHEGPWPHDDRFAVRFTYDVTLKTSNARFTMDEIGLFTVKDGKIVKEEFFYSMG